MGVECCIIPANRIENQRTAIMLGAEADVLFHLLDLVRVRELISRGVDGPCASQGSRIVPTTDARKQHQRKWESILMRMWTSFES
jgi:hypothetical protein